MYRELHSITTDTEKSPMDMNVLKGCEAAPRRDKKNKTDRSIYNQIEDA